MKIYVAAKYEAKEEVRHVYKKLFDAGHTITYDWTQSDENDERGRKHEIAIREVLAVETCDAFVLLPHERGKGQYTELGVALANRKPIFIYCTGVSRDWNIFLHHTACVYVTRLMDLLDRLRFLEAV